MSLGQNGGLQMEKPDGLWARQVHYLDSLESTNDRARQCAQSGAPHGTVIQAGEQTGGKGRLGRTWLSPSGGLWLSLIIRPMRPIDQCSSLALLFSLWIVEYLEQTASLTFEVYWPNDIFLRNRKLGGILLESSCSNGKIEWIIAGIGLNVNNRTEGFPPDLSAISLSDCGIIRELTVMRQELLNWMERRYQDFCEHGCGPFITLLRSRFGMQGREAELTEIGGKRRVKVLDLGPEGELIIESEGRVETIRSAERLRLIS